jgi:signal transduction histidine kinase
VLIQTFRVDRVTTAGAVRHLLAGCVLSTLATGFLALLMIIWGAAVISLVEGPTGDPSLVAVYVVVVFVFPVALAWFIHEFGVLQRSRFRRMLNVHVAEPAWTFRSTLRQLMYHIWALMMCVPAAILIAVPPAARSFAGTDISFARSLLGPTAYERLTQRVETLARSRADVIEATDAERRRIERDLHDGTQQRLTSLAMNLGMAREAITEPSPARDALVAAHDEVLVALTELRYFVRGLHPAVLDARGLDAALSGIAARAPIPVQVSVRVEPRCPAAVEAIAYFIVSEALTNVAKHASASSASIIVTRAGSTLRIKVSDDGRGGAGVKFGGGLAGLEQRVAAVDGKIALHSPAGGPTIVKVELPCA